MVSWRSSFSTLSRELVIIPGWGFKPDFRELLPVCQAEAMIEEVVGKIDPRLPEAIQALKRIMRLKGDECRV